MSTMLILSMLLMLSGLTGATVSDLQGPGKSIPAGKSLLSGDEGRPAVRRQPHLQIRSDAHRSLDFESFKMYSTPPSRKFSRPTIVKLYPPTALPLHKHANMPMRFGRQSSPDDEHSTNSNPNMPQRFGRGWESIQMCAECPGVRQAVNVALSERFDRSSLYWRLLGALATAP